jgi:hypothetical protein
MSAPGLVAKYLEVLVHELRFDPQLALRVRLEAEDHLRQAVADQSDSGSSIEAEQRVIARFGDPRAIARQYAPGALLGQTRRVGVVVLIAPAGIYAMMKGRLAWYGFTQWSLSQDVAAVAATGFSVVRWIFIMALAVAIVGAVYIGSRRAPCEFHDTYRRQLLRSIALCAFAAVILLAAIGLDGVLLGLRLVGRELSATALVPMLSMAVEVALAVVLVRAVWRSIRRVAIADTLLLR